MRIAGTVILFNPKSDILHFIETYLSNIELLLVYDNSLTNAAEAKFITTKKCRYVWDGENLGISKRLNQAIEVARVENFDLLLTMDQDSFFSKDVAKYYMNKIYSLNNTSIGMYGIKYDFKLTSTESSLNKILITSGSVINIDIAYKIGGFDENLFIDGVDTEYCLKLIKNNFSTILFNDITLNHSLGESIQTLTPQLKIQNRSVHSSKRIYYMVRNNFYLRNIYHEQKDKLPWSPIINEIKNAIFYSGEKLKTFIAIFKAIFDFIFKKMGK